MSTPNMKVLYVIMSTSDDGYMFKGEEAVYANEAISKAVTNNLKSVEVMCNGHIHRFFIRHIVVITKSGEGWL